MPLVLSLREGDDFYVSDQQFVLTSIHDVNFTLRRGAKTFDITEREATEVMGDVFVSAGDQFQKGIVRAVIDAPRDVLILRGDKYRASAPEGVRHEHQEL